MPYVFALIYKTRGRFVKLYKNEYYIFLQFFSFFHFDIIKFAHSCKIIIYSHDLNVVWLEMFWYCCQEYLRDYNMDNKIHNVATKQYEGHIKLWIGTVCERWNRLCQLLGRVSIPNQMKSAKGEVLRPKHCDEFNWFFCVCQDQRTCWVQAIVKNKQTKLKPKPEDWELL